MIATLMNLWKRFIPRRETPLQRDRKLFIQLAKLQETRRKRMEQEKDNNEI